MAPRILLGPVSSTWSDEYLPGYRQRGDVLVFDTHSTSDVVIQPSDSWGDISAKFPGGWEPDVIVCLPSGFVPVGIWSAPYPIAFIVGAAKSRWHALRRVLRNCDLVICNADEADAMKCAGIDCVRGTIHDAPPTDWVNFTWPGAVP